MNNSDYSEYNIYNEIKIIISKIIRKKDSNIELKEKCIKILNEFLPKYKNKENKSIIKVKYKIPKEEKQLKILGKKYTNNNKNRMKIIINRLIFYSCLMNFFKI